jgi:hypothetical protein
MKMTLTENNITEMFKYGIFHRISNLRIITIP